MDAEELIRKVPLFHGLDRKHLGALAKVCHERSFPAGEVTVREGEGGIGLFIIGSGGVVVVQERGGHEERLRTMAPGEVFGEISLLTDHPRTATIRATAHDVPRHHIVELPEYRGRLTGDRDILAEDGSSVACGD